MPNNKYKEMECPVCGGLGKVRADCYEFIMENCSQCKGSGTVIALKVGTVLKEVNE